MRKIYLFALLILFMAAQIPAFAGTSLALPQTEELKTSYTLSEAVVFALEHSPALAGAQAFAESEKYSLDSAKSEKRFKLNFGTSFTKYKYSMPVTPISWPITLVNLANLNFGRSIYNAGVNFSLPIYTGGGLEANISAQTYKKIIAENNFKLQKQELVYNISSVYYKIMQLEKNYTFAGEEVKQTLEHKKDVEASLKAGTCPKVELIKTQTKLAQAKYNELLVKNSIENAYELLKVLMGFDDKRGVSVVFEETAPCELLPQEASVKAALAGRPDYLAALNKIRAYEKQRAVAASSGKPNISLAGQYADLTGGNLHFDDNWQAGVNFTLPILDGGFTKAEVEKNNKLIEQAKKEEEALRQSIIKEVKDAYIDIENARGRILVLRDSIGLAEENYRIENLKFKTGSSTSTDLFDAQTDLLNSKTDYCQALYDEKIAIAALKKAVGEDWK